MRNIYKIVLLLFVSLFLINCSSDDIAGGGIDTGNTKVVGSVISYDSLFLEGAYVTILPSDFDPIKDSSSVIPLIDTTQNDGSFSISIREQGFYSCYVLNPVDSQSTLLATFEVDVDSVDLDELFISDPGSIKILPGDYGDLNPKYFYIAGTNLYGYPDSTGTCIIPFVPSISNISVHMVENNESDTLLIKDIDVIPNDTVTSPLRVLILVGGDTTIALTDRIKEQRQLLIDSGAVVFTGNFETFSFDTFDTSSIDMIYCAYNINWSHINANDFISAEIPLVVTSGEGYAKLGMTDTVKDVSYGTETEITLLTGVNGYHPVLEGTGTSLSATVTAYSGGAAPWGKPNGVAGVLIGNADQTKKYVFAYHVGDDMVTGSAPAARIGMFTGNVDIGDNRSRMIFWRTILWGTGKL